MMKGIRLSDIFAPARDEAIVQSFLDTDYYKFPMGYFIWQNPEYRNTQVTFRLIIRDKKINPMNVIPEKALREQLDAANDLKITQAEASFVGGMTMSDNKTHIIPGSFLAELQQMSLPDYHLEIKDGNMELTFTGSWWQVTWWEIFGMEIVSELYYYYMIKNHMLSDFEISTIYARMIEKLHKNIQMIKEHPGIRYILFDTRRRHSRKLQAYTFEVSRSEIRDQCVGTSNVLLSMQHGSANPFGTNAHELPMVKACLAGNDVEKIVQSQYDIVEEWYHVFGDDLAVMLIDAYGTKQFLDNAPSWMAQKYKGVRPDSMDPTENIDLMLEWWKRHGVDPQTKMVLPSDGLSAPDIVMCYLNNYQKLGALSFGWGTLASNDCRGVWPREIGSDDFRPFSMACKVIEANGVSAVKLSDNPNKATGDPERVALFKAIFGTAGSIERDVIV